MLNARVREGWDRLMNPLGRRLGRVGVTPDVITIIGVLIQAAVAALIIDGRLVAAGLLAIASAFADAFDGAVAKARGRTSRFGALLDSTTDRLSDALIFVPVAWLYGVNPDIPRHDEKWIAALALVTLVASFLVSYVKARAEGLGFECNVGVIERAERLILIIAALVFEPFGALPTVLIVLTVFSVITLVQRLLHVRRQAVRAE